MKVGRRDLQVARPDDLDDRLIELTGHSAKEMRTLLDTWCPAGVLAGALMPFVKDSPSRQELAETIDKAGVDEVRAQLRQLYDRKAHAKKED